METKTIKGIVEAVNHDFKSVKISGQNYSGKFNYKGLLPNVGDEVEIKVVSSVSKKDGKTYWNHTDVVVIKACKSAIIETRESKSIDMILSYAKDLVVAGKCETLDKAVEALIAARKLLVDSIK